MIRILKYCTFATALPLPDLMPQFCISSDKIKAAHIQKHVLPHDLGNHAKLNSEIGIFCMCIFQIEN